VGVGRGRTIADGVLYGFCWRMQRRGVGARLAPIRKHPHRLGSILQCRAQSSPPQGRSLNNATVVLLDLRGILNFLDLCSESLSLAFVIGSDIGASYDKGPNLGDA